jgi:hypothetical protein
MTTHDSNDKRKRAREWWIIQDDNFEQLDDDEKNGYWGDVFVKHPRQGPLEFQLRFIHVVEKSAYDAAVDHAEDWFAQYTFLAKELEAAHKALRLAIPLLSGYKDGPWLEAVNAAKEALGEL